MIAFQRLGAAIDNNEWPIDIFIHMWQQPTNNSNAKNITAVISNFKKEKNLRNEQPPKLYDDASIPLDVAIHAYRGSSTLKKVKLVDNY